MRKLIHEITLFLKRVINSPVGELTRAQRALRFWIDLAWHCARALRHDRAGEMAAALTYRTIFSLIPLLVHAELAEFVAAGLTPYEALRAATYAAVEWLGIEREAGTVEVGRRADLLLLDANPLTDVANVRRLRGVVLRGSWIPKRLLETP